MLDLQRIRTQQAVRQAEGYLELDMPQHALDALRRGTGQQSRGGHAAYLEGEALRSLGRCAEAIIPLLRAASDVPDQTAIWLALGWCYKRTGKLDRAIWALERGLLHDAESAIIHYNLACYWSLCRRKDLALDALSRALELDPSFRKLIDDEPDFDPIRSDSDFQSLVRVTV